MQQPQQQPQQKTGLLGSTLSMLENKARSMAPGLANQVDRVLQSVGVSSTSSAPQHASYYQQPQVLPPNQQWTYAQPGAGYPQPGAGPTYAHQPVTQVYPAYHPGGYQQQQQQQYQQQQYQQQQYQVHSPQPWQQPPPGQYTARYPQQHQQPYGYQTPPSNQQHHQQQQQPEIPILEATVDIKPSGLPVGTQPAAVAVAAAAGAAASQQQQPSTLQQQLQQLWAGCVPAAAQGAAAASVVGRWYHQDAGVLSEVTFMSDGRCYWSRSSTCSSSGAADSAAGGVGDARQVQQGQTVWHGVWRLQGGDAKAGQLGLVYFVEQQGQPGTSLQQQQQRVVTYQRSALDDTLVLDGLAHIKLGAA